MGDRLRAARRTKRLSLRDLAGRLGLSASLISQVETGRARPSVSTLYAIANELDVSLDELLFNDAARSDRAGGDLHVLREGLPPAPPAGHPPTRSSARMTARSSALRRASSGSG